jgi:hypothetical protein
VFATTLAWLIAVCVFKASSTVYKFPGQWLAGTGLGAVARLCLRTAR